MSCVGIVTVHILHVMLQRVCVPRTGLIGDPCLVPRKVGILHERKRIFVEYINCNGASHPSAAKVAAWAHDSPCEAEMRKLLQASYSYGLWACSNGYGTVHVAYAPTAWYRWPSAHNEEVDAP